ncbi:hypothetical protein PFISCL1PPCAC_26732 [Pristionchus fissidentatus]|uniref:glutathione transferase n=1 Tax=Pristionchus fissidentatus TaxID=1538716 RepID=A0AAV5WV70_9BILA|nr:hypothetical protein PFISCL1PPCAC_26732 [Pristionchus fissidentatus]
MSDTYKLVYFNLMGRAEPIRLIFAQAGVAFEDQRIDRAEWVAMKSQMPYGQLPVLEINGGQKLSQSRAIERYLAKKFDLAGKDEWEQAKVDEMVMGVEDLLVKLQPWFNEKSEAKKIEIFRTLVDEEIVPFLTRYEKFLDANGTGFFVGDKITLADLSLFHIFWFFNKLLPGSLRKYAGLTSFQARMNGQARLKEWIDNRPKTEA